MRRFSSFEEENIKFLVGRNIDYSVLQITETGYKKSILDATEPMRAYLLEKKVHDYACQQQGTEYKVTREARIITDRCEVKTQISFYRPCTKKGDPRLWIYKMTGFCCPNDIIVILSYDRILYVFNMTRFNFRKLCASDQDNPLKELIDAISFSKSLVAYELLGKLRNLSREWHPAEILADTGIGRTIETLLGIRQNPSKNPDYKGIELKSFREQRPNVRKTLFSRVPDWNISMIKSSREFVERYGYLREGCQSYRNTISCNRLNAQHLGLTLYQEAHTLAVEEKREYMLRGAPVIGKVSDVVVWNLMKLHQALLVKHHETFWIEVLSKRENNREFFRLYQIEHTKNPIVSQFDTLLEQGLITVDLLLGRSKGHGDTFSFKIAKRATSMLFPESKMYLL